MTDREQDDRLAEGLGASRVVDLGSRPIGGPLDLLALRYEIATRLRSSGGRPSDPEWTISRQVPFKEDSWRRLQTLANEVGTRDRRVGAAQLAAMIIEYGLDEVQATQWDELLEASHDSLMTAPEACRAAGVSFRQLETWRKDGVIKPARVQGRRRWFSLDSVVRMMWLRNALQAGAHEDVRSEIGNANISNRYLVISDGRHVRTEATRKGLLSLLLEPGSHSVIDQMRIRLRLLGREGNTREGGEDEGRAAAV